MSWYKNTNNLISVCLCVVTCILAFNYWSVSQQSVVLEARVRVCNQKELDFNGVASECKKRISELHDKISILNSDKEVIATQKNSLTELAASREDMIKKVKAELKEETSAKERLEGQLAAQADLQEKLTTSENVNSQLQSRISELESQLEAHNANAVQPDSSAESASSAEDTLSNDAEESLFTEPHVEGA